MRLGVVFPQTEIGRDPSAIREFVQGVEEAGFDHLLIYDHVLGADRNRPGGFSGPYDLDSAFHEPFVLYGYLAAQTSRLELATAVIVLPQRQTALVAKQAAQVDLLSAGRLRLGVGLGWNPVEYEALGESFSDRGRRLEEQVALLRALWEQRCLEFEGHWHRVDRAGLNPLPDRRIPVWVGAAAAPALERAARIADGWFPLVAPDATGARQVERVRGALHRAGRDPAHFGIEPQLRLSAGDPDSWREWAEAWRKLGATHLSAVTMGAGCTSAAGHLELARAFREAMFR